MANKLHKPVLAIVAGPNGSGKTTITEALLKHKWLDGCEYINPDNIANSLGDWNNPADSLKAAQQAALLREVLLSERKSIAFESVFSAPDKVDFVMRAKQAGFYIRMFFVCTESPEINAYRITQRYLQGGHEVPISKIVSRYYKSIQQAAEIIPFVDRMDLFDNSKDGEGNWTRLVKFGPDSQVQKYVADKELSSWARPIFEEMVHFSESL